MAGAAMRQPNSRWEAEDEAARAAFEHQAAIRNASRWIASQGPIYHARPAAFWYGLACGLSLGIAIAAFLNITWLLEVWG